MTSEIVVNGRFLSRRVSGVERHGREILSLIGDRCRLERTRVNGWRGHLWEQLDLPRKVQPASVLWSPANSGPLLVSNQALTLHDLSPLEHPEWFRKSFAAWYRLFLPILVKRVRVIFTPSEYVRNKICRRFGVKNIVVTPNGVDRSVFHPAVKQERYGIPEKYILFVGTLEPRKNLTGLLEAWERVKDDFKDTWLIIAGTHGSVFAPVSRMNQVERVHFIGFVEEECLPGLYVGATLFVLPSFDEGFGLPILEAMACGTPVVTSDGGALPEVLGESGVIFKLSETDGLTNAIRNCLSDQYLLLSMKEKGLARAELFPWQRPARIIWNALHES
ncbi:MAG TPA: glycosyltransferase family 1 protein [Anaerolineales bacterium]|nr:glycosyltransferase family 1 protein [Anaerolineales bacterium]